MKAYCMILAGGFGSRVGGAIPKQFQPVGGVPIVVRTLSRVLGCRAFERIVVALHPDWTDRFAEMLASQGVASDRIRIVSGGGTRNDSMRNALRGLRTDGAGDGDVVVVCDAVRPFVTVALLESCVEATRATGACVATVPAVDTMLIVENGRVTSVPPRNRLFHGQTPCGATVAVLEKALEGVPDSEAVTGTAQLLALSGADVRAFPGSPDNFKITTPEDMVRAERMVAAGA